MKIIMGLIVALMLCTPISAMGSDVWESMDKLLTMHKIQRDRIDNLESETKFITEKMLNVLEIVVKNEAKQAEQIEALEKKVIELENAPRIYIDEDGGSVPEEFKKYLEQYNGDLILVPNTSDNNLSERIK